MVSRVKKIAVEEYTTPAPVSVTEDTNTEEVHSKMMSYDIRHIPVLKGGEPVGIISDRDIFLLSRLDKERGGVLAKDIMTESPFIVRSDTPIDEVVFEMSQGKFGSALVQYDTGEFGIFTSTDALNALVEILRGLDD